MRAHLYFPVVNFQGDLQTDQPPVVRLYEPGTIDLISDPIYQGEVGVPTWPNPMTLTDGILNVYFADERRLKLGITIGSLPEVFYTVDALMPKPTVPVSYVEMTSPDHTVWRLTVDNSGVLHTQSG